MRAKSPPIVLSQNVNFPSPNLTARDNSQEGVPGGSNFCPAGIFISFLFPPTNICLTLKDSFTFFVCLPQTSAEIEFTLLTDNDEKVINQKTFKVDQSGIVGIMILPTGDSNKSLEVGKRYVWSFSVVCQPDDRSSGSVVKGFVQCIAPQPTLNSDLANPDPMTWVEVYAKNEFGTKLSLLEPKCGDRHRGMPDPVPSGRNCCSPKDWNQC